MCVVTNATSGAETMTLAASSVTLKTRNTARMRENPNNATADEKSSFSVKSTYLQNCKASEHGNSQMEKP